MSARTHEQEIKANQFPGVPKYNSSDKVIVKNVTTVTELVNELMVGDVIYLAYFGHSWGHYLPDPNSHGVLYIGGADAPDTNLSDEPGTNNTPVNRLPADKFKPNAQIRLFGCQGGWGQSSVAQSIAEQIKVKVYAYTNDGGSLFTTDKTLGHGGRRVTQADINAKIPNKPAGLWLIPINGTPSFKQF